MLAAPGQSGVVYPSAVPADHTVRAGVGAGLLWFGRTAKKSGISETDRQLSAVDVGIQPVPGVQISSLVSFQVDGQVRANPGFVALTVTVPSHQRVRIAGSVAVGQLFDRQGAAFGVLLGDHAGRIGWDLGAYPLKIRYTPDVGWAEVEGGDRTPTWDLVPEGRLVTGGVRFALSKVAHLRLGFPDGLTVSYAGKRVWVDVGGGSLGFYAGDLYLKAGFRI
ncbi:MAG: hypothetical protein R3F61_26415 [Myxococcota bacterium]